MARPAASWRAAIKTGDEGLRSWAYENQRTDGYESSFDVSIGMYDLGPDHPDVIPIPAELC